tara:strand:+ start:51997 stop:52383 length:387 start_codon:yes stop_codon:yes gene_type:complete
MLNLLSGRIWLIAGIGIVTAGILMTLAIYHYRLAAANAQIDQAKTSYHLLKQSYDITAATLATVQAEQAKSSKIVATEINRRKQTETALSRLRERIENVPEGGCVGPAVRSVIDQLRTKQTNRANPDR